MSYCIGDKGNKRNFYSIAPLIFQVPLPHEIYLHALPYAILQDLSRDISWVERKKNTFREQSDTG